MADSKFVANFNAGGSANTYVVKQFVKKERGSQPYLFQAMTTIAAHEARVQLSKNFSDSRVCHFGLGKIP